MRSLHDYKDFIAMLPVNSQSAIIKRETWKKIEYSGKQDIEKAIFRGENEVELSEVELSREDVRSETDITKKLVMVLMWGYPTGGRGNNIKNILDDINELSKILSKVDKQDLSKADANDLIYKFGDIRGLGMSTWSKFLYFFNVSVDSKKCQIFDSKIVESLNKKPFSELDPANQKRKQWRQDHDSYYQYIKLMGEQAKEMGVCPDKLELFLFYFNLNFKFSTEQIRQLQSDTRSFVDSFAPLCAYSIQK